MKLPEVNLKPPEDVMGNPIVKDTLLTVQNHFVVVWRVVAVDNGSDGTPARIRLSADITITSPQGLPFINVVRVATPGDQEMLERWTGIKRQ